MCATKRLTRGGPRAACRAVHAVPSAERQCAGGADEQKQLVEGGTAGGGQQRPDTARLQEGRWPRAVALGGELMEQMIEHGARGGDGAHGQASSVGSVVGEQSGPQQAGVGPVLGVDGLCDSYGTEAGELKEQRQALDEKVSDNWGGEPTHICRLPPGEEYRRAAAGTEGRQTTSRTGWCWREMPAGGHPAADDPRAGRHCPGGEERVGAAARRNAEMGSRLPGATHRGGQANTGGVAGLH